MELAAGWRGEKCEGQGGPPNCMRKALQDSVKLTLFETAIVALSIFFYVNEHDDSVFQIKCRKENCKP